MKTIILTLVLILATSAWACTTATESSSSVATKPADEVAATASNDTVKLVDTKDKDLLRYATVDKVKQVIIVQYTGTTHCAVKLYVKAKSGNKTGWTETLSCNGNVGKNGMRKVKAGDKKTPVGDFGMITAFGIEPNPGTSLPYVDVDSNTYCCGDAVAYNRIINIRKHPHKCHGEHMIKYNPQYSYGFFFDYNKNCVPGKGAALFFHCIGNYPYTGGCIAVKQKEMIEILRAIDINARLIVRE